MCYIVLKLSVHDFMRKYLYVDVKMYIVKNVAICLYSVSQSQSVIVCTCMPIHVIYCVLSFYYLDRDHKNVKIFHTTSR